jgi:DNA-directed RNA polymerase specialized sigma24 family protein
VLVEGLGYKAAGERMGVQPTSVQHLVYQARFDLRERLASVHAQEQQ